MKKHWHMMNGSSGCLPDNNEVHTTKHDAISSASQLFDDVEERGMVTNLRRFGYHSFSDSGAAGADYVEVSSCSDPDCCNDD